MKTVKILTDKYIIALGTQGPILTPMQIDDSTYESLVNAGIRVEEVKDIVYTPTEGDKVLFTGEVTEDEIENGESEEIDSAEVKVSDYSYKKNKKKR